MVLYLRCVWANKLTLLGYILLVVGVLLLCLLLNGLIPRKLFLRDTAIWLMASSAFFLVVSVFGFGTQGTYKRTIEHLRKQPGGRASRHFANFNQIFYCWRKGYELAVKDYNAAIK